MSSTVITVLVLVTFLLILFLISYLASRLNVPTPDDFYLANRSLGTVVLTMTISASFFSTWTLLGAVGSYYREGVWFIGFAAWAITQTIFIWIAGSKIWYLGRKYDFVTPGDMVEKYYKSPIMRLLFAIIGIVALVPYMLIQITGGASSLASLTGDDIPYWIGVLIMGGFVGLIVILSGGRGAAWSDTFMGFFFGAMLIFVTVFFIVKAGGFDAFKNIQEIDPDLLTNKGDVSGIVDTGLGLVMGYWVMPHMWQKYYSAKSPMTLAKTMAVTPFWASWLMAVGALFIGILAHSSGLVPGLSNENSDQIIPIFFSNFPVIFGAIIVAAIVAAAISTINSQLLSSASLLVTDIYTRFFNTEASEKRKRNLGRFTLLGLTIIIVILALTPAAEEFLIPLADLGFGIGAQLVPAAIGPLMWRGARLKPAIWSIILGEITLGLVFVFESPIPMGPTASGLIVGLIVFIAGSLLSQEKTTDIQNEFHDSLIDVLYK